MKFVGMSIFCLIITASVGFADPRIKLGFEYWRGQREASAATYKKLEKLVDVSFVNVSLGDALEQISNDHDISFHALEYELADVGLSLSDTFSFVGEQLSIRQVLDIILRDKIQDLGIEVDGPLVRVTIIDAFRLQTRVYDVTALVSRRPEQAVARNQCEFELPEEPYDVDGGYGQSCFCIGDEPVGKRTVNHVEPDETCPINGPCDAKPQTVDDSPRSTDEFDFDSLADTIKSLVTPNEWELSRRGMLLRPLVIGDRQVLVVRHNQPGHFALAELLSQLEDIAVLDRMPN